ENANRDQPSHYKYRARRLENDRVPRAFIHSALSRRELMALTISDRRCSGAFSWQCAVFIPPSSTRTMLASLSTVCIAMRLPVAGLRAGAAPKGASALRSLLATA